MAAKQENLGIHMKKWCREHETEVLSALEENRVTPEALARHKEKILWLQHERLVHLIVTVMVVFAELFVVFLVVVHPELGIIPAIIMLGLAVLLGFYFYHYFFLENAVQRWYKLTDRMADALSEEEREE